MPNPLGKEGHSDGQTWPLWPPLPASLFLHRKAQGTDPFVWVIPDTVDFLPRSKLQGAHTIKNERGLVLWPCKAPSPVALSVALIATLTSNVLFLRIAVKKFGSASHRPNITLKLELLSFWSMIKQDWCKARNCLFAVQQSNGSHSYCDS